MTCCPASPTLKWIRKSGGGKGAAVSAIEDGVEAGKFEQVRSRRSPSLDQD